MQVQAKKRKRKPSGIVVVVKPLLVPKPDMPRTICEPSPACLHPLPCWAILGCERLPEVLMIEEMQHYDG